MQETIIEELGGKKFVMSILFIIMLGIFCALEFITIKEFIGYTMPVFAIYITGNVIAKFAKNE